VEASISARGIRQRATLLRSSAALRLRCRLRKHKLFPDFTHRLLPDFANRAWPSAHAPRSKCDSLGTGRRNALPGLKQTSLDLRSTLLPGRFISCSIDTSREGCNHRLLFTRFFPPEPPSARGRPTIASMTYLTGHPARARDMLDRYPRFSAQGRVRSSASGLSD
jgi:hypothetical protein